MVHRQLGHRNRARAERDRHAVDGVPEHDHELLGSRLRPVRTARGQPHRHRHGDVCGAIRAGAAGVTVVDFLRPIEHALRLAHRKRTIQLSVVRR